MENQHIKVLLIEDNPGDKRLISEMLKESTSLVCELETIDTLHAIKSLEGKQFDIVLLDLHFEDITGLDSYQYANALFPMTPIIVLTGLSDERLAYEVVKFGAQDYLLKDTIEPKSLLRAIRYSIERKKADIQKDEFLGFASHELKTPVTSIKAYVQLMELQAKESTFGKKKDQKNLLPLIKKVDAQVDKLTHLINDLLDVTKVQAGKLQFNFEKFFIGDILNEVIEAMQLTTKNHKIILKGKTQACVYGDKERTAQILINLISNAIKYSPQADKVVVSVRNGGRNVWVEVRDYGIGITQENQHKIFDRFYRVTDKNDHKETYPGLGLGLYIAAEIAKRQNGSLSVESEVGNGSSFLLELPAADINDCEN